MCSTRPRGLALSRATSSQCRPGCHQPRAHRVRLSFGSKEANYSTDYRTKVETNCVRSTDANAFAEQQRNEWDAKSTRVARYTLKGELKKALEGKDITKMTEIDLIVLGWKQNVAAENDAAAQGGDGKTELDVL